MFRMFEQAFAYKKLQSVETANKSKCTEGATSKANLMIFQA